MNALRIVKAATLALTLAACVPVAQKPGASDRGAEPRLVFKASSFSALDGWEAAGLRDAHAAFQASCRVITGRAPGDPLGGDKAYGTVGDWQPACQAALARPVASESEARTYFETWFDTVQVFNGSEERGLFTGYYEPELNGSRQKGGRYRTPLLQRPSDLVEVELGQFRPSLKGERVAGRVVGGRLVPFSPRREIVAGGLGANGRPLVYVDDAVGAFFLQIQGSGRIKLDNGEIIRAAYDGQNGHIYTAIGRILVDRGEIPRETLSMQGIRAWLEGNPDAADALMNENASYVFFKEVPIGDPTKGANGAQGVPLTAEASLAVDLKFHALGAPMWVDASAPSDVAGADDVAYRRLFIAQDTGGAIRGPIRGDVYWGAGARAEQIAGRMAHRGRLFVLLPKPLAGAID